MQRNLGISISDKTKQSVEKTRSTWFGHVASLFQRDKLHETIWQELEELLISADIGISPTQKLLDHLRQKVRDENATQPVHALNLLKEEMLTILNVGNPATKKPGEHGPHVMLMVGVNGAGKTTSIAKLVKLYTEEGKRVVLGAADTYRAGAVEQLQVWGQRLNVDVIAHQPGADPGAVTFDTMQAAMARKADVIIIDTAGRLHTKLNLMEEMKKVYKIISNHTAANSQSVLLTIDATTGRNGLHQARSFTETIQCDGVFLAKLDSSSKGGVVLAIADELKLPVLYIGTGEQPEDIAPFNPKEFVEALFLSRESPQLS